MTNIVVLHGRLSRPVSERVLPSGDRLAVLDLTVPAAPGSSDSRSDTVPLAWFGAPTWALELEPGAGLVVLGRVRRRFFRAGQQLQSRTEVVVEGAAPERRSARVAELMVRAGAAMEGPLAEDRVPRRRRAPATFP
ncbi:MAG TPA: hypothetical protein VGI06_06875 [Acidimicrobiales bacterium]